MRRIFQLTCCGGCHEDDDDDNDGNNHIKSSVKTHFFKTLELELCFFRLLEFIMRLENVFLSLCVVEGERYDERMIRSSSCSSEASLAIDCVADFSFSKLHLVKWHFA